MFFVNASRPSPQGLGADFFDIHTHPTSPVTLIYNADGTFESPKELDKNATYARAEQFGRWIGDTILSGLLLPDNPKFVFNVSSVSVIPSSFGQFTSLHYDSIVPKSTTDRITVTCGVSNSTTVPKGTLFPIDSSVVTGIDTANLGLSAIEKHFCWPSDEEVSVFSPDQELHAGPPIPVTAKRVLYMGVIDVVMQKTRGKQFDFTTYRPTHPLVRYP